MSKILIIYFSGTGGTQMAAESLMEKLNTNGQDTDIFPLDLSKEKLLSDVNIRLDGKDRIVMIYPVYSFDAPTPVYRWLRTLKKVDGIKASVLSVAAGADGKPNRACRQRCIRVMQRKGFIVDHEDILAMPSNYCISAGESIDMLLIKALPIVTEKIADDIVHDNMKRKKKIFAPIPSITAGLFRIGAMVFGLILYSDKNCTDCKLCEKSCPTGNIKVKNGRIKTSTKCAWCMRCTYICPKKSIKSAFLGFSILKEGFNIKSMKKRAELIDEKQLLQNLKTDSWVGAVEYINTVYELD